MKDVDRPRVAAAVYKEFMESELLDVNSIPYALDDAVQSLRRMGAPPHRWVPYIIHVGASDQRRSEVAECSFDMRHVQLRTRALDRHRSYMCNLVTPRFRV